VSASPAQLAAALPQTQCRRCGYEDCEAYAQAIAHGEAEINRCPPGGAEGIERLARLSGRPPLPLDPSCGEEAPRALAVIDEAWCIGCTLCIQACPVDCIIGAPRQMHTVIDDQCTGCELCVLACPVDCIAMEPVTPGCTGWTAWSPAQADAARARYEFRQERLARERHEHETRLAERAAVPPRATLTQTTPGVNDAATPAAGSTVPSDDAARRRATIEAALARARAQREKHAPGS